MGSPAVPPPLDVAKGHYDSIEFGLQDSGRELPTPNLLPSSGGFSDHSMQYQAHPSDFGSMRTSDGNTGDLLGLQGIGGLDNLNDGLAASGQQHLQLLTKMPPAALRELHALVSQAVHTQSNSTDEQSQRQQQSQPGSNMGTPDSSSIRPPQYAPRMSSHLAPPQPQAQASLSSPSFQEHMRQPDLPMTSMPASQPMRGGHGQNGSHMQSYDVQSLGSPNPGSYAMGGTLPEAMQGSRQQSLLGSDVPAVKRIQELKREAPSGAQGDGNNKAQRRRPLQVISQGNGLPELPTSAMACHQLGDDQGEMIISPRSARMLVDCVTDGQPAGAGTNATSQQLYRDTNGHSSSSAVAGNDRQMLLSGMPFNSDGGQLPAFGMGFETPRRAHRQRELCLQPFDDILRSYSDSRMLKDFNGWMASRADETGRQFSFNHSESVAGAFSS